MNQNPFTLTELKDGIHKLVFDLPGEKVNKLSVKTLESLEEMIDSLAKKKDVSALIVMSGKSDVFIAGADIKEFEPAFKDVAFGRKIIDTGQRVFKKIAALPFPVLAAIHGACLGGGCELSLACSHRIATDHPKTLIGLPETTLGIIPGWGGTQRLPRLVGLKTGTEMIVTGKPQKGSRAYKIGLVDALSTPEFLEERAIEFLKKIKFKRKRQARKTNWMNWALESNPLGRAFLFSRFKKAILEKTKGFYPHPSRPRCDLKNLHLAPGRRAQN